METKILHQMMELCRRTYPELHRSHFKISTLETDSLVVTGPPWDFFFPQINPGYSWHLFQTMTWLATWYLDQTKRLRLKRLRWTCENSAHFVILSETIYDSKHESSLRCQKSGGSSAPLSNETTMCIRNTKVLFCLFFFPLQSLRLSL